MIFGTSKSWCSWITWANLSWLVVEPYPSEKIWKSVGMIITHIWEKQKRSKPPTSQYHPWGRAPCKATTKLTRVPVQVTSLPRDMIHEKNMEKHGDIALPAHFPALTTFVDKTIFDRSSSQRSHLSLDRNSCGLSWGRLSLARSWNIRRLTSFDAVLGEFFQTTSLGLDG